MHETIHTGETLKVLPRLIKFKTGNFTHGFVILYAAPTSLNNEICVSPVAAAIFRVRYIFLKQPPRYVNSRVKTDVVFKRQLQQYVRCPPNEWASQVKLNHPAPSLPRKYFPLTIDQWSKSLMIPGNFQTYTGVRPTSTLPSTNHLIPSCHH